MRKIKLTFNDFDVDAYEGITLAEFVQGAGLVSQKVIIELNDELIVSDDWSQTILKDHDRILAVTFVGGG